MTAGLDERVPTLDRPVFEITGHLFSWREIVIAARGYGSWRELERTCRQGLACQHRLAAAGGSLETREVLDATTRFRYAHNLISGDDLAEWLERWAITASEWRDFIRRVLLRERWEGELDETLLQFHPSAGELEAVTWPEAVCSGFLERSARRLAGDLALATSFGEVLNGAPSDFLARALVVAARARSLCLTEEAIEREVALHRREWLRLDGMTLALPAEDMAREAVLSIRIDGRALADVAADCGGQAGVLSVLVSDLDEDVASVLLAAREGDVVGPLARDGAFTIMQIERKSAPSTSDPDIRVRAEQRLVSRTVEQAINRCVTWHESF